MREKVRENLLSDFYSADDRSGQTKVGSQEYHPDPHMGSIGPNTCTVFHFVRKGAHLEVEQSECKLATKWNARISRSDFVMP